MTFFDAIGIDGTAPIMQLVVITAAASSLNAGLYSTGRILHSMGVAGSAPKFTTKVSPLRRSGGRYSVDRCDWASSALC